MNQKMKIVVLDNLIQMDAKIAGKFIPVQMVVPEDMDFELVTARAKASAARFREMFQE